MFNHWFSPSPLAQQTFSEKSLGSKIIFFDKNIEKLDTKLAIIGIDKENADAVRKFLFQFTDIKNIVNVTDLGNIKKNDIDFVTSVIKEVIDSGIVPIVIGGDGVFIESQFKAYHEKNHLPVASVIDSCLRMYGFENGNDSYLNNILYLKNKDKAIGHLSVLATQGHLVNPDDWDELELQDFDLVRLGKVRSNIDECEPLIREANGMAFHISALRQSEAAGHESPTPSGLFIEEACQLVRYAGISDRLTSMGFYGFDKKYDLGEQTAKCIAQMIWYFIDGFANRQGDYPVSSTDMIEYLVEVKGFTQALTFWKSNKSGRWWVQIPTNKHKKGNHFLFSCSYKDYQEACNGELPERIWNGFKRLS